MSRSASVILRGQWQQRMERFCNSPLTVGEFCRHEGVSLAPFYQWRRKLVEDSTTVVETRSRSAALPTFLAVQLMGAVSVQVTFPNGARLTLPADDHELLRLSLCAIAMALYEPLSRQRCSPVSR